MAAADHGWTEEEEEEGANGKGRGGADLRPSKARLVQQRRWQHTVTAVDAVRPEASSSLDFENHRQAFKDRSTWDICKSLTILRLCGMDVLARNSLKMCRVSRSVLGKSLYERLMKSTVYGHFVAGDSEEMIEKTIVQLRSKGIRAMIACTNEEEVGEVGEGEAKYEASIERMLECIRLAAAFGLESPKTQFKASGAMQTELLLKLGRIKSTEDVVATVEAIAERLKGASLKLPDPVAKELSDEEFGQLDRGIERLKIVGQQALAQNVVLLVDAEYVSINAGIGILSLAMMSVFNRYQPLVWTTYQSYLKAAYENVVRELAIANRLGVYFGAKIVRGAYLACERALALRDAYPDPTNESYEATNAMYNRVASFMIDYVCQNPGRCSIVIATHNEESVRLAVQKLEQVGMPANNGAVAFAQLYGMCDQITYPLAQKGFVVYKSMPFGAVDDVIPYLYRRAMENVDVLKGSRKEVRLLRAEMKHRLRRSLRME